MRFYEKLDFEFDFDDARLCQSLTIEGRRVASKMNFFRRFSSTVRQSLPPLNEVMLKEDLQTRVGAKGDFKEI